MSDVDVTRRSGTVLVAGGTGGLGVAVLRCLLDAGHPVVATWRSQRERDRTREELGDAGGLTLVEADLLDAASVDAVVVGAGAEGLSSVVNLVGGYAGGQPVHQTDPEQFEGMLRLNLRPTFLLARAAMPRLVEAGGGTFVAVSSRAAVRPFAGAAGYITAKAGVLALVAALDAEYRDAGVRANVVLPSVIDIPANRAAQPDADHARWVPAEQIAEVIRFLVSAESAPLSGAQIPVYGRA